MAARDKVFGGLLSLLAILFTVIYLYAMIWGGYALLAVQIVVTLFFLLLMAMLFWMGYTIMTTPTIQELEKRRKK